MFSNFILTAKKLGSITKTMDKYKTMFSNEVSSKLLISLCGNTLL